ncbi:oxidoreductase [Betaproteobacteria bacterium SCN1]|jgi:sulfite reductase (NADPH) flavoprotein alpha-component|nr:oxidoreductase [Betaproteobacteria bacterium SCN1]
MLASDPLRLLAAGGVVLAYLGLCFACLRPLWRRPAPPAAPGEHWVCYASQTGGAEHLARLTADALRARGETVRLAALNALDADALAACRNAWFVVSTTGDGDAPDNAQAFRRRAMQTPALLGGLDYGLVALGSRNYAHFCGFGRSLDDWLAASGAHPRFERIEVDDHDSDALTAWHDALGIAPPAVPRTPGWQSALLAERRLLNPGSAGEPVYWIELERDSREPPHWEAGDVLDVLPPADSGDDTARTYTLATLPHESDAPGPARLGLVVRAQRRPDGTPGRVSNWLASGLRPGDTVQMRLRAQPGFRIDGNRDRPLLLVGGGTGIAGLVAHLKARAETGGPPCWLVYGERNAAHDHLFERDIARWQADGALARVDAVFSRDGGAHRYVQHRLAAEADALRRWIDADGAIYVCGSRVGMAEGVDAALAEALGRDALDALAVQGRYRRDVY